jgi:FkbM family methyltransferase
MPEGDGKVAGGIIQEPSLTPRRSRGWYYFVSACRLLTSVRFSSALFALLGARQMATPIVLELRRSGLRFPVRGRMDVWMLKEVCLDRDYERVGDPLQNGWTVVDVGAGIGAFAIDTAARHADSVVYAFEPSPESFALLERGIELNGVLNVRVFERAIGPRDGTGWLDVSAAEAVTHRMTNSGRSVAGAIEVTQSTLAAVFRDFGLERCDFLKIDCEGGEYDILLTTSADTLARIERICLEYHDGSRHHHRELVEVLERAGFAVSLTPNRAYRELGFLYARRATR